jgi:hypothetical protein
MAATEHPGISLMSQYNIVLPKWQASDSSGKPIPACDPDQCAEAIRGEGIPVDLSSFWHRRAVIRGIRDSLEFATSPAIVELCSGDDGCGQAHQFSRARNARLIMSDIIPDMQNPATQPYCIWYPELASEETYREVARQYPSMRYQVGRACAVACYTDLYKKLDLLPDVSIAEESREVDKDAEIYKIIMSAPQRYVVMEDFSRSVYLETPRTPAFLNGDMKPRWALEQRVKPRWALKQRVHPGKNLPETTADDIDIEEDGFIGLQDISLEDIGGVEDYTKLGPGQSDQLWMPLPPDLPFLEKRLQTQMAAWEGNVDRYSRLMHPRRLRTKLEYNCVLRGIYHSTTFARWWAYQLETNPGRAILPGKLLSQGNERECREIRTAINARMIMNNDISGIDDDSDCLPWVIWGPVKPSENTLGDLVRKCPSMRHQTAITCIICDYESIFRCLKPPYTKSLYVAARRSENPFYLQYLEEIMKEHDKPPPDFHDFKNFDLTAPGLQTDLEPRDALTGHTVSYYDMEIGYGDYQCRNEHEETPGTYGGGLANAGRVERYMWLSTETAQKLKDELDVLYPGADIGTLYGDDELYSWVSRRIQPMR